MRDPFDIFFFPFPFFLSLQSSSSWIVSIKCIRINTEHICVWSLLNCCTAIRRVLVTSLVIPDLLCFECPQNSPVGCY